MKMHHFAAAAATVLTLAIAAPASAQVGDAYIGLGTLRVDLTGIGDEGYWTAGGSYATPVGGLQLGGEVNYMDFDNGNDLITGTVSLGTHNEMRAFGGQLTYSDFDPFSAWEAAGYAQTFGERFTGTARLVLGELDLGVTKVEYRGGSLDGAFFITDNASLNLGLDFIDYESLDGEVGGNLGFEWKPMEMPVGIFIEGSFSGDVSAIQIGGRYTFGGSLLDRSQSGAPASSNRDFLFRTLPAVVF